MEKKDLANQNFKNGDYEQAIKLYSEILEDDEFNHIILSNRSAAYIKLEQYNLALTDAVNTTKIKPDSGKAWGRLGAALYGLEKFDESLVAYNKANELEPSEIYIQMMNQIKEHFKIIKSKLINENNSETIDNPQMNNLFGNLFDLVTSNPKIMEKLTDPDFQGKVVSLQNNPIEAMKDKEIMGIMSEMMMNINL
jgi:stress-induced-phosphoprotein 1